MVSQHISGNPTCKQRMWSAREEPIKAPEHWSLSHDGGQEQDQPLSHDIEEGENEPYDGMPFDVEFDGNNGNRQPRIEEVEDEYDVWSRFVRSYPGQVASALGQAESLFEAIKRSQEEQGLDPWGPFADE
ncbi:hypothetical protein PAXRUDRAFT_28431 [Paxillus rubicundulus Ve08.2h10]|uniref:Unplaced genomic scaffold scaffold_1473, whole genome shotgun sequence n=1 Tax=Paxillus rubicundulus Ve08.2h10 TaxID=930991 RepID=A0A0D0DLZ1_9AGAM|nr:hypothetical protein PAXRUDRAFT_28431 [Paxillus rubicundulus Ve08.2h10]